MTTSTVVALAILVALAAVAVLSVHGTGDGADLLDWDPSDRIGERRCAEEDELARALDEHNRRRRARGLPPQTEMELRSELARRRHGD